MSIAIASARQTALEALGQEDNPFVAWDNLGALATLGGTSTLTGGAASNAVNGNTYSYWLPDVPSSGIVTLVFTFDSAITVGFAGIAAHNIGTLGGQVSIQYSSDAIASYPGEAPDYPSATWTDGGAFAITPTDDSALAWRMVASGNSHQVWRIRISGLTEDDPLAIGVAFMGAAETVIPRRFYQGFAPIITPTEVNLQSNVSVGGNLLGSSVVSQGSRLSATVNHLEPSFVRGTAWTAFQRHFNQGKPAFFGWRPETFTGDLHYIWRDGDLIRPENSGPRDFMSVSINARAYEPEP